MAKIKKLTHAQRANRPLTRGALLTTAAQQTTGALSTLGRPFVVGRKETARKVKSFKKRGLIKGVKFTKKAKDKLEKRTFPRSQQKDISRAISQGKSIGF